MHNALKRICGRESWFEMPTFLKKDELDKVKEARRRLSADGKRTPSANEIVAELTFGFWASLLDERYEKTSIVHCIDPVFPNIPSRKRYRDTMLGRIERVRKLRNRVFHHEPIWHWSNLAEQHDLVYNVLSGIDEKIASYFRTMDRFPSVHLAKWDPFRAALSAAYRVQTDIEVYEDLAGDDGKTNLRDAEQADATTSD